MIGVDGMWKRIMELAIFALGWQTSQPKMSSIWFALFLIYLLYICWQVWHYDVKPLLKTRKKDVVDDNNGVA